MNPSISSHNTLRSTKAQLGKKNDVHLHENGLPLHGGNRPLQPGDLSLHENSDPLPNDNHWLHNHGLHLHSDYRYLQGNSLSLHNGSDPLQAGDHHRNAYHRFLSDSNGLLRDNNHLPQKNNYLPELKTFRCSSIDIPLTQRVF